MQKFWESPSPVREVGEPTVPTLGSPGFACAFPQAFTIGNVRIAPATVLAPMAGVTDTVFRRFIKNLGGCGLIMTEFTSADGVLRDQRVRGRYLHFYEDEHPVSAQLFGSNPQVLAEAARLVEDLGFDLVDLNLGCPAKKVVKCNGGSGLLRDLPLIKQIFEAVRAAVKIPFTVKFRAGWNDEEIVCVELARMAESCGLGAVALHARTREQGYSGTARWEWIASVKQAVKIPVIGNGDIRSPEDACSVVAQTGCDAVMIGRMAPANPWIFRQIEQYRVWAGNARAEGALPSGAKAPSHLSPDGTTEVVPFPCGVYAAGEIPPGLSSSPSPEFLSKSSAKPYEEPTEADRYQMIRTYFRMLLEEEMAGTEGKMKQFASWFTHGIPGGAALRKTIYDAKNGAEILGRVEAFFAARAEDNTEDCDRAIEPAAAEV